MRSRVMCLVASVCVCMCVCMYVCIYMWTKEWAIWGLTTGKSPVSVIYCSLAEFNGQKEAYYARRFILGKKFGTILLTGQKKGPGKLYYSKPRLAYMQYSYAMLMNAERQHQLQLYRPTISLQVLSVLIVLRAHRVRVLWNSSW